MEDHLIWSFLQNYENEWNYFQHGPTPLWFKIPNIIQKFLLMLYAFDVIFLHTTSLSRHQEFHKKWKRLTKVKKAKSKARELFMPDFHDFLVFLKSLGVFYLQDFVFWRFEVKKAKKAATQGQITKSQRSKKKDQKLVS